MTIRVGFGYDSHRTDPSRPLVLGGVTFIDCPGLAGHSDADVLVHAIIDAILSAAGLGDIGSKFPDSDPRYRNADSIELLGLSIPGEWKVEQIDATVVCDRPKVSENRKRMIERLRTALGDETAINVKGKTSEGLGFPGRGEGMAAFAVVLLSRK